MFCDGQAGEANAGTRARRLVHLAVDEGALRTFAAAFLVHAGFDELMIEVVTFAGSLADAGEHRITAVGFRDVVDQFLNQHGLADAGTADRPILPPLA